MSGQDIILWAIDQLISQGVPPNDTQIVIKIREIADVNETVRRIGGTSK